MVLAEEILSYTQTDLWPEEIVLLDAYKTVFVWLGKMRIKPELKLILEIAEEYLVMGEYYRSVQ